MLEPSPTAPDGSVTTLTDWAPRDLAPESAILCRLNAPLVETAFALLRDNISCYILGKDIGERMIKQLGKFNAFDLPELRTKVLAWADAEVDKLELANRMSKAAQTRDLASCLVLFINKTQGGPSDVPRTITRLFTPKSGGIVLSTIHKSKGLEWPTVYILDVNLIGKFATLPWMYQQETNLHYVAATRAKEHLVYITTENRR
jgi:DNA helicase II / ATP-dependent DNA helicase PcrA